MNQFTPFTRLKCAIMTVASCTLLERAHPRQELRAAGLHCLFQIGIGPDRDCLGPVDADKLACRKHPDDCMAAIEELPPKVTASGKCYMLSRLAMLRVTMCNMSDILRDSRCVAVATGSRKIPRNGAKPIGRSSFIFRVRQFVTVCPVYAREGPLGFYGACS